MIFVVYRLTCGNCGYHATAMSHDRAKAAMLDHLLYTHGEASQLQSVAQVPHTEQEHG